MEPEWSNGVVDIYCGDARDVLISLESESVHCVVTSPPYWGLRDYGIGEDALGLEATPELYVQHVVEIFQEVKRVLRKDGTLWLNLGDSYAAGGNGSRDPERWPKQSRNNNGDRIQHAKKNATALKPKDLVGIPWRVAFALQADGWYLRSDIVWSKPNPMPESVTDRPTKAHEYLFLLSKSERYFYDADAIREANSSQEQAEHNARYAKPYTAFDDRAGETGQPGNVNNVGIHSRPGSGGRNKRTVWEIATQPYPDAHFATFPTKLVEPCILASTSEWGVCAKCGAPYERIVEKSRTFESGSGRSGNMPIGKNGANLQGGGETVDIRRGPVVSAQTVGWRKTCFHRADVVPATVLDPFAGSGTVGEVAQTFGREAFLIEVNPEYVELSKKRIEAIPLPMKMG